MTPEFGTVNRFNSLLTSAELEPTPMYDGPGDRARLVADQESGEKLHLYDKAMIDNCFGIICGDFCGKCLHKCPSRKVIKKTLKDYDLSARHSSLNHPIL